MIIVTKGESTKYNTKESLYLRMTDFSSSHLAKIKSLPQPERQYVAEKNKSWECPLYMIKEIISIFEPNEIKFAEDVDLEYEKPEKEEARIGIQIFEKELQYIKNEKIREFTTAMLNKLPDYFWIIPSSSTGFFHPEYALGESGLVRHVKACVTIANELLNLEMYDFSDIEKDIILSALFGHDGVKHGIPKALYSKHDHPLLMGEFLRNDNELYTMLDKEIIDTIIKGIERHTGQFVDSKRSKIILPKPETELEKFIHQADFLASRKFLEVKFD